MSGIRKYPKGATHCVNINHKFDERFYRLAESGTSLELFAMGRHQWVPSEMEVEFLETLHKLENPDALVGE